MFHRNKFLKRRLPKNSWREWLKVRSDQITDIDKPEIYKSRSYPYGGSHLEHMEREFAALGWDDEMTSSERKIRSQVTFILKHLIENWESAETAMHVIYICNRILRYKILSPIMNDDSEWSEKNELGASRNIRNPSIKRFVQTDKDASDFGKLVHYAFDVLISTWPNGERFVEPGGKAGIPISDFPFNPGTHHPVLRETMIDSTKGQVSRPLFNGKVWETVKTKKPDLDDPVYNHDKKQSLKI